MDERPRYANGGQPSHSELDKARADLARYMNGDYDVPRLDVLGRPPVFIDMLWDDVQFPVWPLPWRVPNVYVENQINGVYEVPFGSYAWWVRRLQRTVDSVID